LRPANLLTLILAVALSASLVAGSSLAATPKQKLKAKQAEARKVLAQVNALDEQMGRTVEAWNGARYELGKVRAQLKLEQQRLGTAKQQQAKAIARVRARVVALYESSDQPTTLAVLLGSSTITQMIDQINAVHAVAAADHDLAVETSRVRADYEAASERLQLTQERRAADVAQLDVQRKHIESMLAQRKQLLSHIQSEVGELKVEEARQQARLEAEAKARLAAQAAARAKQAQEAAAAAAARAAKQKAAQEKAAQEKAARQAAAQATATTTTASTPTSTTTATTTTTTAAAPPTDSGDTTAAGHPEAATIALQYLGVPYLWGGASPAGFDCSGLVMYVYAQIGVALPHYAAAQYGMGTPVPREQLQPGDLVFFNGLDHVGIYIGGGQMVHAPHTGDVVKIAALSDGGNFVGARRL
jgi:peptidoglycan DL-endopeptidase CwlO